jgi:para-nitrobenzyl esterase
LAKGTPPVWGYLVAHQEPGVDADKFGAFHSTGIRYVFGTLDLAQSRDFTAADRELSITLSSYWVNFVKSGNPNGTGLPAWLPLAPEAPTVIEFKTDRVAERPLLSSDKLTTVLSKRLHRIEMRLRLR